MTESRVTREPETRWPETTKSVATHSFSGRTFGSLPLLVESFLQVKIAAATINELVGVLSPEEGEKIRRACEVVGDGDPSRFPVDLFQGGGGIGFNSNLNEQLAAESTVAKELINASQSTSDVCAAAFRVTLLKLAPDLLAACDALHAALDDRRQDFAAITTLARTCLQDASPVPLGDKFAGQVWMVARRRDGLGRNFEALATCRLGTTVLGRGDGAPREYRQRVVAELARITGLPLVTAEHPVALARIPDDLFVLAREIELFCQGLLQMCRELRLLASGPRGGFGEIILPAVIAGSSFYRDKVNPTLVETLFQCAAQVTGMMRSCHIYAEHGDLDLNIHEPAIAINLIDAVTLLSRCLPQFTEHCVKGIVANEARCAELAEFGRPPGRDDSIKE